LSSQKEIREIEIYSTKRKIRKHRISPKVIEREIRNILSRKVSGTLLGIFLLIPEHLRLGTWDLIKSWTGDLSGGLKARLAFQIVNEAALCVNGIRQTRSLNHKGFELANGLPFIATDKEIHNLLAEHTIEEGKQLQINLARLRESLGHYSGNLWAFDPHRITTFSKRIMPKKKSKKGNLSKSVLQTFFSLDAETGQPFGFTIGSSGVTVTKASIDLLKMMKSVLPFKQTLLVADTEHESRILIDYINESDEYDILMPAARRKGIMQIIKKLDYQRHWAGYSTAERSHKYKKSQYGFRLIGQRCGEIKYSYKPFIATGDQLSLELLSEKYPQRWKIEEFFNFEGKMGWDRASTMNLNIRYGKMSLALIAQAVTYELKKKLSAPYKQWTAEHLANSIFKSIDADLRVQDDTIIVTMYNVPETSGLKKHYENLPEKLKAEKINPKIPWLYNFKLDFRFK